MSERHQYRINVPVELFEALREQSRQQGISINELIVDALAAKFADMRPIVLGWVKLDRWGELDPAEEPAQCPECGQDIDINNAYVGLLSSGQFYGPVCRACGSSE